MRKWNEDMVVLLIMIWYQQVKREEAQKLSGGTTEVGKIRLIFGVFKMYFKIHENPWLQFFFIFFHTHTSPHCSKDIFIKFNV